MEKRLTLSFLLFFIVYNIQGQVSVVRDENGGTPVIHVQPLKPEVVEFTPFVWSTPTPADCPFRQSTLLSKIKLMGVKSGFHVADTFYPTWAENDLLYTPLTDGRCWRLDGTWDHSDSGHTAHSGYGERATTAQAVLEGDNPLDMVIYSLGTEIASARPYEGRYPCGSLHYNGVWYYGTYCLGPTAIAQYGDIKVNWPWLGPFVGFRISEDNGLTWKECPHTPEKSLFGETGINGYPVKIGSPHFVDFGKNMEYSPDGKAYMVAHGADINDPHPRFWNSSWITGDQVYLLRVEPGIENMNDASEWEFYAGKDVKGNPVWTNDFKQIKPLLEWNDNMGCVTVTYNPGLKKYIMCVTDGGNTVSKMNTYLLESGSLTGEWKIISYMEDFGEQAYFVNIPSKFISKDGKTMWLAYSGNFATNWNGENIVQNPPGSHYGLVMQKIELQK